MLNTKFLFVMTLMSSAAMADPITVFGVPLGGKAPPNIPICSDTRTAEKLCWVDRVKPIKGYKIGMAKLPNDSQPRWAQFELPTVHIDAAGSIEEIRFTGQHLASEKTSIYTSIASRFGKPTSGGADANSSTAEWTTPDIWISQGCLPDYCILVFRSAAAHKRTQQELADRNAAQQKRPASP